LTQTPAGPGGPPALVARRPGLPVLFGQRPVSSKSRRVTNRVWVPRPAADGARGHAFVAQQLLGVAGPRPEAALASELHVRLRLVPAPPRDPREAALGILATPAVRVDRVAVLNPDVSQFSPLGPAVAAHDVHKTADVHLSAEPTGTGNHGGVVHGEGHRSCG